MNIHFVRNDWGHSMPVHFDKCCDTMTRLFSPENKPHTGFWFDNTDCQLKEINGNKILRTITQCQFCNSDIKMIKRELKELE